MKRCYYYCYNFNYFNTYLYSVHGTVRVDRLKGDQTWTKLSPVNIKQSSVSLASDVTPSFTQLWYPVTLAKRLGQFER